MLKTELKMIVEVPNRYIFNNSLKTVAKNKNVPKIEKFSAQCPNFR